MAVKVTDQENMESSADELLPMSRRLDWRFLLPDPTLNRVIYVGPESSTLRSALQRFSLDLITEADKAADRAVLVDPTLANFKHVLYLVDAFYVELHRCSWSIRLNQIMLPTAFTRAAHKAGFSVSTYWHYPDFEAATRIIPMSVASPLLNVITKNRHDMKTRIKALGMRWFLESGLLTRTIPCLGVVGFKR